MKKGIRLTAIFIVMAIFASCFFVGCTLKKDDQDDKDKKYDVTIKVKCSDGKEWIFPPDVKEIHYEYDYDGVERTVWLAACKLLDHPQIGNEWFNPPTEGANAFQRNTCFCPEGGSNHDYRGTIKEKGVYCYSYRTDTSNLWNKRAIKLYITVK